MFAIQLLTYPERIFWFLLAGRLVLDAPGLGLGDALPGKGVPRPREHPGLHLLQLLAPEIHLLEGCEADADQR